MVQFVLKDTGRHAFKPGSEYGSLGSSVPDLNLPCAPDGKEYARNTQAALVHRFRFGSKRKDFGVHAGGCRPARMHEEYAQGDTDLRSGKPDSLVLAHARVHALKNIGKRGVGEVRGIRRAGKHGVRVQTEFRRGTHIFFQPCMFAILNQGLKVELPLYTAIRMPLLLDYFSTGTMQALAILVAVDVVCGIAGAVASKTFRFGRLADFLPKMVIGYLGGFAVIEIVADAIPSLGFLVIPAFLLAAAALLASTARNLHKLGLPLPGSARL